MQGQRLVTPEPAQHHGNADIIAHTEHFVTHHPPDGALRPEDVVGVGVTPGAGVLNLPSAGQCGASDLGRAALGQCWGSTRKVPGQC